MEPLDNPQAMNPNFWNNLQTELGVEDEELDELQELALSNTKEVHDKAVSVLMKAALWHLEELYPTRPLELRQQQARSLSQFLVNYAITYLGGEGIDHKLWKDEYLALKTVEEIVERAPYGDGSNLPLPPPEALDTQEMIARINAYSEAVDDFLLEVEKRAPGRAADMRKEFEDERKRRLEKQSANEKSDSLKLYEMLRVVRDQAMSIERGFQSLVERGKRDKML